MSESRSSRSSIGEEVFGAIPAAVPARRRRHRRGRRMLALALALAAAAAAMPWHGARADTLALSFSFPCTSTKNEGGYCADGRQPVAGLMMDGSGNLYGTTFRKGGHDGGTVFELTPNAARTKWTTTVLYRFCAETGCTDGAHPEAGLIMDGSGNLYGTTAAGGAAAAGTAFELVPNATRTRWTEKVLHSFCAETGCTDGAGPAAGLIMDGSGNLYGTTELGGGYCGEGVYDCGTVFQLVPNAAKTKWTEKVLYHFWIEASGYNPAAGLIMDGSGNLYGTTAAGGGECVACGGGTVFQLVPNAAKTKWAEKVLHTFCSVSECADGYVPEAGLIMDGSGNLYGTTAAGGAEDGGMVFELVPNAAKTKWTEKVLDSPSDISEAGLIMDGSGNLYGTTTTGGDHAGGTVFELVPNSAKTKWAAHVLYSFCSQSQCVDGDGPEAAVTMDGSGNLYGTTTSGGDDGAGTVFGLAH